MRIHPEGVCDFGEFSLQIDRRDFGGRMYESLDYWADLRSPIEAEIVRDLQPTIFVDVGANYGFTALCHHAINPSCHLVLIEPSPALLPHLRANLSSNGVTSAEVIPRICADRPGEGVISLNPHSSQDNRVRGEGWEEVSVGATTLDEVLHERLGPQDFVYLKVDTQGFEQQVMAGGERILGSFDRWIMRAEFAPYWLEAQGTRPSAFLEHLISLYSVSELPRRPRFRGDTIASVQASELSVADAAPFTAHVASLARDRGWCDLLISPRGPRAASGT